MQPVLAALTAARRHLGLLLLLAAGGTLLALAIGWLRNLVITEALLPLFSGGDLQQWQTACLVLFDLAVALLLALPAALVAVLWLPRLLPAYGGKRFGPTFGALVVLKLALWLYAVCLAQWLHFPNGLGVALPVAIWGQQGDALAILAKGLVGELLRIGLTAVFLGGIVRKALNWPGPSGGSQEWSSLVIVQAPFALAESLIVVGLWALLWSNVLPAAVTGLSWLPGLLTGCVTMISWLLQLAAAGFLLQQRAVRA